MERRVAFLVLVIAVSLPACEEYNNFNPPSGTSWNGYKIFLSSAHHGTYNGPPRDNTSDCLEGYSENLTSDIITWQAAQPAFSLDGWYTLASRGYRVRVGHRNLTKNAELSNAWGSDYHIIVHTNAATYNCSRNANLNYSASGTTTFYLSSTGRSLAQRLLNNIGPLSPGTRGGNESVPRLARSGRGPRPELAATAMPAAYLEAAFHTFGPDVDYLSSAAGQRAMGRSIATSVDQFLGYPR